MGRALGPGPARESLGEWLKQQLLKLRAWLSQGSWLSHGSISQGRGAGCRHPREPPQVGTHLSNNQSPCPPGAQSLVFIKKPPREHPRMLTTHLGSHEAHVKSP